MKNNILNSFGYKSIEKSILNPNKIDSQKYDIFSENQVKEFVKSVVDRNIGMALEIQKSVVSDIKTELSNLIPVNIKHNGIVKKFYISKAGKCVELCKAFEPVNKKEGYFDNNINEDEVLEFIKNHDQVDDEMLVKKFGNEIVNTLNSLQEDGKLDVDDDGYYLIIDEEEQPGEGEEQPGDEEEQPGEEQPGEGEEQPGDEEEQPGEEQPGEGEKEQPGEGEEQPEEEQSEEKQPEEEQPGEGEEQPGEGEEQPGEGEEQPGEGEEQPGEGEEQPGEGEEKPGEENQGGEEQPGEGEFNSEGASNEELEAMAKKTATVSLLKFYKNSSDERLKEIAAIELKSRGVSLDGEGSEEDDKNLPDDKAALDELEKWTKDYLGTYDKDDLIKYVVELANQSPAKRKELKDLYREFYSASNSGNKALKIDEEDFKNFLTENYFNNFTPGDLQSYAFLMISKNPTEYRKYKKMRDAEQAPII